MRTNEPHFDDTPGGPGACVTKGCNHSPVRHDYYGCHVEGCGCLDYSSPPGWRPEPPAPVPGTSPGDDRDPNDAGRK